MSEIDEQSTDEQEIGDLLGCEISEIAQFAAQVLRGTGAYSVLCPACGQGETSAYLARRGFRVTAYDTSEPAVRRTARNAELAGVAVECFVDDVITPRRQLRQFDGLFCHGMLHQMRQQQRRALLRSFYRALRPGGVLVVSVLSAEDERYGYGRQVEDDTFEFAMGEHLHFYSGPELQDELSELFDVAQVDEMEEAQVYLGVGRQTYRLLVATALRGQR